MWLHGVKSRGESTNVILAEVWGPSRCLYKVFKLNSLESSTPPRCVFICPPPHPGWIIVVWQLRARSATCISFVSLCWDYFTLLSVLQNFYNNNLDYSSICSALYCSQGSPYMCTPVRGANGFVCGKGKVGRWLQGAQATVPRCVCAERQGRQVATGSLSDCTAVRVCRKAR